MNSTQCPACLDDTITETINTCYRCDSKKIYDKNAPQDRVMLKVEKKGRRHDYMQIAKKLYT